MSEEQNTVTAPERAKPRDVTPLQKLLVLFTLGLGLLLRFAVFEGGNAFYGLFWLGCLALFIALNGKRFFASRAAIFAALPAAALCLLFAFHPNNTRFLLVGTNVLALPITVMATAVTAVYGYEKKREGAVVLGVFYGYTAQAVTAVPRFFSALGALFGRGKNGAGKHALLGVAVALPVVAVVLALLSAADAVWNDALSGLFANLRWDELFADVFLTLMPAILIYSLLYNMTWGGRNLPMPAYRAPSWPPVTLGVAMGVLIAVYAAFCALQYTYLFGGRLPAAYTYSEYARSGFTELMWVAAINFLLFALCLRYVRPSRVLKVLSALLLAATALLLGSAATRLLLYIGAYRLTFNRILPLWWMIYLVALVVLCAVRLKKQSMPLLSVSAWIFLYWYLVLNIPDWQRVIEWYNAL